MRDHVEVPTRLLVTSPEAFTDAAVRWIAARIRAAVAARGSCSVALSGGSTPRPVYRALATARVPWSSVEIFFADERRVAHDGPDSNYRLVRETLLDRLPQPPFAIWPLDGRPGDHEAEAAYERVLPVRLDLVILGMGRDAHTASLFPGSEALGEASRRVCAVAGPPGGHARLTLTPLALRAARELVVLVAGEEKADAVAAVFDSPVDIRARPAQLALRGTWILDRPAAGRILRPG